MGYYTDYELSPSNTSEGDLENVFEEITGYSICDGELHGVKWYDHDKDMIALSKKYPDTMWTLDGVGEETGDVWRKYYKNGKHQSANTSVKVTHEPFDESKLL